jgi:acyl-coenzyme A synthetase/AMP-(fatty) acid ligase
MGWFYKLFWWFVNRVYRIILVFYNMLYYINRFINILLYDFVKGRRVVTCLEIRIEYIIMMYIILIKI